MAAGSYCPGCQPRTTNTHVATLNGGKWKRLSQQTRKASPFCERCGSTNKLETDHILPQSILPELTYRPENLRVLCRTCNNARGNTYTDAEAAEVLARLRATYKRRPTKTTRQHIEATENALTRGYAPTEASDRRPGRRGGRYT